MDSNRLRNRIHNLDPEIHSSLIKILKMENGPCEHQQNHCDDMLRAAHDPFLKAYEEAADAINTVFITGTIQYINEHQPGLSLEISKIAGILEELWQSGADDDLTIQRFRELLTEWVQLYIKGTELHSKERRRVKCQESG